MHPPTNAPVSSSLRAAGKAGGKSARCKESLPNLRIWLGVSVRGAPAAGTPPTRPAALALATRR